MPPSFLAASGMLLATWYCVKRCMSPIMFMPIFWSRIFCNSSGSETFWTTSVSSARP
jgi:hypothetical protein